MEFKSPKSLSQLTMITLFLLIFACIIDIFFEFKTISTLNNLANLNVEQLNQFKHQQTIFHGLHSFYLLIFWVFFMLWIFRYSKNTHYLSNKYLKYTPGWTVGYFFIPIVNFFRPHQAISELYFENTKFNSRKLVNWWWATWIYSTVILRVVNTITKRTNDIDLIKSLGYTDICTYLVRIICYILLLKMMMIMNSKQLEWSIELEPKSTSKAL